MGEGKTLSTERVFPSPKKNMDCLHTKFLNVDFKNPVIAASGTYGYGREYENLYPLEKLGGISVKGTTLLPKPGNPVPRIAETPSGMLNSIGLENPGIDAFINNELPDLQKKDIAVILNISGNTPEQYGEIAAKASLQPGVDIIEVNISCPNVKQGGAAFGTSKEAAFAVTKAVREATNLPVMVKLSPNVTKITEIAKACEDAGADGLSLINTLLGMRIDVKTRRPILANVMGGLSGPAIFPVAVRMVYETARAVKIPICGMGGISTAEDALEIMMAGAQTFQIGAAIFADAYAPLKIAEDLSEWCRINGVKNISEIIGVCK